MVENHDFFIPLSHSTTLLGGSLLEYCHPFWHGKTRMVVGLPDSEKNFEDMYNHLDTIPACDRQTDRRTSCDGIVRTIHTRRVVKIEYTYLVDSSFDHEVMSSIIIIILKIEVSPIQPLGIFKRWKRSKIWGKRPHIIRRLASGLIISPHVGRFSLHPPSPFISITHPESWYSCYCPTVDRRWRYHSRISLVYYLQCCAAVGDCW